MPRKSQEQKLTDKAHNSLLARISILEEANERLETENEGLREDHKDAMEEVERLRGEHVRFAETVRQLSERLKREEGRSMQALKVAEEAAHAAGAIGRVTSMLTPVLDSLDRKLLSNQR
jgi:phage shock protein A